MHVETFVAATKKIRVLTPHATGVEAFTKTWLGK
jgi:hypothetical protein